MPSEALDMVRSIRGFKLLSGVRGEAAADLDVLVDVLLRLSLLAERHPQIAELDLNPFLAAPRGERALAVDARLRVRR
jgi:acyl-CoA synthetase (NDP forming)